MEVNWLKATNFIPKAGEIIVYDAETEGKDEQISGLERDYYITYPRIKVGNGVDNIITLAFSNKTSIKIINDIDGNVIIGIK